MPKEPDAGDMEDWARDRDARRGQRCQCGGDMPGRCPGPAFCPMCQPDTDDECPINGNAPPEDGPNA